MELKRNDIKATHHDLKAIAQVQTNLTPCVLVSFVDFDDEQGIVAFVVGHGTYERCHELMEHVAQPIVVGAIRDKTKSKCGIMTEEDWRQFSGDKR